MGLTMVSLLVFPLLIKECIAIVDTRIAVWYLNAMQFGKRLASIEHSRLGCHELGLKPVTWTQRSGLKI
jgi:hypothetical protein